MQHRGWWMGSNFFPPELVMRHQKEIGLTEDQRAALRSEASKLAGHVTDLRWELNASRETLAGLIKQDKPDEKAIMEELGKVLKIGDDMKLSHMEMLIHIKNILTPEQQAKLTEIRRHMEHNLWGPPGMEGQEMGAQPHVGPQLNFWPGTPRIPANVPPPPGGQQ
jgi:Spy/CpxP family protein refolding chaperone